MFCGAGFPSNMATPVGSDYDMGEYPSDYRSPFLLTRNIRIVKDFTFCPDSLVVLVKLPAQCGHLLRNRQTIQRRAHDETRSTAFLHNAGRRALFARSRYL